MLTGFFTRVFGSRNQRVLRRMWQAVEQINALEPEISALSDQALQAKTQEFRTRLEQGETLNSLLPELLPLYARLVNAP